MGTLHGNGGPRPFLNCVPGVRITPTAPTWSYLREVAAVALTRRRYYGLSPSSHTAVRGSAVEAREPYDAAVGRSTDQP